MANYTNTHQPVNEIDQDDPFAQIEVTKPATVRQVVPGAEGLVEFITGRDWYITGSKKDGTPFLNRRVNNCSLDKSRAGVVLLKVEEPGGGNRSFDMALITEMRAAPPEMVWADGGVK